MKTFSKKELINKIRKIGIKKNSIVLVHSGINYLGKIEDTSNRNIPKEIFEILKKIVGKKGTLIFPAYFYDYARKKIPFNLEKSEPCKTLGVIPQYVFKNKKFYRSKNPITSLIGVGHKAKYICKDSNARSYGYDSAWDRLTKVNATILFLGIPLHQSMTYIHQIEFNIGVPHMYIKKFFLPITSKNKIVHKTSLCYVRYLDFNIEVNQKKFEKDLLSAKILKKINFGMGTISSVKTKKIFDFGIKKLNQNSYYFLNNIPKFNKNKIPIK